MREKPLEYTNRSTLLFTVILCFFCALILSILTYVLKKPQKEARELYKSQQLLQAAAILSYDKEFLLEGKPARYDPSKQILIPSSKKPKKAKNEEILAVFEMRILLRLTNDQGETFTFEEAGLDQNRYLAMHAKYGYADLPYKLVYLVLPNLAAKDLHPDLPPYGYVIPINGYGLWDAIYGYLGLQSDADTVLEMTWYDQQETPGLGGNISLPKWQAQFKNKVIFQKTPTGKTHFEKAQLGIQVVKTTAFETYGQTPLRQSAVDGIAGASITIAGVNQALRTSLAPYRPFLIKRHRQNEELK
jgi:Na+-transporting NADH:ubiquinone oxidoreductase subunit C